jgi:hypothetical protein
MQKILTSIKLASIEDFSPFMTEEARARGATYHLFAAVCHHGRRMEFGHYTAVIWCEANSVWYLFDDANEPRQVSEEEALHHGRDATLLFYRRDLQHGLRRVPADVVATNQELILDEDRCKASSVLFGGEMDERLVEPAKPLCTPILRRDLHTLRNGEWVNDEIINFFLGNVGLRVFPHAPVVVLNTNFYRRMCVKEVRGRHVPVYDYPGVRRWTKRHDVFALERVFFPINLSGTHWCLVVVNFVDKKIQCFDSLNPDCQSTASRQLNSTGLRGGGGGAASGRASTARS